MKDLNPKVHLYPIDRHLSSHYLGIMPNIKFNYLYRDSANYKKYGYVIFANPHQTDLAELEALIRVKLIDETWFYADEWKLPELFLAHCDFSVDPTWHEFESVEYTEELVVSQFEFNLCFKMKNIIKATKHISNNIDV